MIITEISILRIELDSTKTKGKEVKQGKKNRNLDSVGLWQCFRLTCILWVSEYTLSHVGKDSGFEHRNLVSPHRAHLKYNVCCQSSEHITVTWK